MKKMNEKVVRGTEVSMEIKKELSQEIASMKEDGIVPGLVTILVGDDPASQSYVAAKNRTAKELGIKSTQLTLDATITEEELLEVVDSYNEKKGCDGILIQLPLPKHINEEKVINAILPEKDVDGFHPVNVGKMVLGQECFLPCTPHGILELLVRAGVETKGAEVVVVGRSNIVGKPVANLMMQRRDGGNATVRVCHTGTKDLAAHCRQADILIAAAGVAKMITGDMVKEGVAVIDVGVNRIGTAENGKALLAGDVDFDSVLPKASCITPVPGGVGPMTITMLMKNTVLSAKIRAGIS